MVFLWVLIATVGLLLLAPLLFKVDKELISTYYSTPVTMLVGAVCTILGNLFNIQQLKQNDNNKESKDDSTKV